MNVSVVIPTHNRPEGLMHALNSLLNQSRKPNEIIVVNDNSSIEYPVESYTSKIEQQIKFVYVVNKESKGACYSRNKGAKYSTGDILMFLDDDDAWDTDKISEHVDIFNKYKNIGLVYSGRKLVYDDERDTVVKEILPNKEGCLYPQILTRNIIGPTSSVSLRRNVFFEAGMFDSAFPAMQDYDLWVRCCRLTKVKHDNSSNLIYTISRNNNQISGNGTNHFNAFFVFMNKYKSEINKLSFFEKRKTYSYRYRSVAVSLRRVNYFKSLKWAFKATYYSPRVKDIVLYLPPTLENMIRKFV